MHWTQSPREYHNTVTVYPQRRKHLPKPADYCTCSALILKEKSNLVDLNMLKFCPVSQSVKHDSNIKGQ